MGWAPFDWDSVLKSMEKRKKEQAEKEAIEAKETEKETEDKNQSCD